MVDIPDGSAIALNVTENVEPASIILLRQGSRVFAYQNICPHAGRRLDWAPGRFLIEDGQLICASHGASFAIETGKCDIGPCTGASLASVAIELVGDEIRLA